MRYRPIKTHVFGGKRWRIRFRKPRDAMARCEAPDEPAKTIFLPCRLPDDPDGPGDWQALALAIHEALHALFWDYDEEAIQQKSRDLAYFIWRLGFRPTCSKEKTHAKVAT